MKYLEKFESILDFFKKIPSKYIPFTILIIVNYLLWKYIPDFKFKIFKITITELYIKITLSIISIICIFIYYYKKNMQQKNKTKLPGIGLVIISSNIHKEDFEKDLFFQNLKAEVNGIYKIKVYSVENIKKFIDENESITDKIMPELNLSILLVIEEKKAKKDSEDIYKINVKDIAAYVTNTPFPISDRMLINIQEELSRTFNNYFEISSKNSLTDSEKAVHLMKIEFDYIMILLTILSLEPEKSLNLLDRLNGELNVIKMNQRKINHIKKSIPFRYLEAYSNYKLKLFNNPNFFKEINELNNIMMIIENSENVLENYYKKQQITKDFYEFYTQCIIIEKAIILCELGKYEESLKKIQEFNYSKNSLVAFLFLAYIYAHNRNYDESYKTYIKVFNRKDLDDELLKEIIMFLKRKINFEECLACKFCYSMVNYYKGDREIAITCFKEMMRENQNIKKIYNEMRKNVLINN